jgi:hypothetical protein
MGWTTRCASVAWEKWRAESRTHRWTLGLILLVGGIVPPARVWQWLIPLFAALAGVGATWLIGRLTRSPDRAERYLSALALGIGVIGTAAQLVSA